MSYPLIGLVGKKRTGKDSVAGFLIAGHGYAKVAFADPLRQAALAIDPIVGFEPTPGGGSREIRYSDAVAALGYETAKDCYPEVRRFLQRLGTDGIRALDDGFWTRIAASRIEQRTTPVVVTDCRFPNEADLIRRLGGVIVRIIRPGLPGDDDGHPSEVALDGYREDFCIRNDGGLDLLAEEAARVHAEVAGLIDTIAGIASAIVAVENINGHVADFDEILDLLHERELETSDENVDRVRAAVDRASDRHRR